MVMTKIRNFGVFQWVTQKYYQIVRQPYDVDKSYLDELHTKHFTTEFTSKYNANLFVDQDRNSGQSLINEILLNNDHLSSLSNEFRILNDWVVDFQKLYQNLKSLLHAEGIEINEASAQFNQLELLGSKSNSILEIIVHNQSTISGNFKLPLDFTTFDNTNLEAATEFNFERLNEYPPEQIFIKKEPSDTFAVIIVFRRLSEIIMQINSLNSSLDKYRLSQTKFIHGNAGMGKSNISVFIYSELLRLDKPVIILNAKSFNGDPNGFDKLFMNNLLIPNNYQLEEVLERLNAFGEINKSRVTLIIDGLNETSFAHSGFSKLWENSLDNFIETLKNYPHLFLVITLRTSYISRIWGRDNIPYEQIQLNGFSKDKLKELIQKYFNEYRINIKPVTKADLFYFSTPLYLDLYCKMLNGDKSNEVEPLLGLDGFEQVFENYLQTLADKIQHKLSLITTDQVFDGINRVSEGMIDELEAFVPKMDFYEHMEGEKVKNFKQTIGFEILEGYLIYLDENHNNKDVIIHTQQEVGGYLLAKKLITDNGSVNGVVQSQFFQDYILGSSGRFHQLKDDILKFLITQSDVNSLIYTNYIHLDIIKKISLLNLQRTKVSEESQALMSNLNKVDFTLQEVRTLISDNSNNFYDLESGINFLFIKDVLLKLSNYELDFAWSYYVYNNYSDFTEFLDYFMTNPDQLDGTDKDNIILEIAIWLSETTIRDLRDKSTRFLIKYFERFPQLILYKLIQYSETQRIYIQERLALVCYGVCLRLQNDKSFVENHLGEISDTLYKLQFAKEPTNPTYNYILIDSYKHIIDLAILKGVFELSDENLELLSNYNFNKDDWFDINEEDMDAVPIANNWDLGGNPDPLRGDFVHYTISRLDNRVHETRLLHTANIYKEIIRLGYISDAENLSQREQSFYSGTGLLGSRIKVDRLGKKYSWMAYFNYAGYLLIQNELGVWSENDSLYARHYKRLSDIEIEPSYDVYEPIRERLIENDFFDDRKLDKGDWINQPKYNVLEPLYEKDDYTLLSAFVDQKLDEKYKTRSWVEARSFFVNKDHVINHIDDIENREFDWKEDLHGGGSLSKVYFGELYWADTVPKVNKDTHNTSLLVTKEITRTISDLEVRESGEFNYEDVGKEVTETINETCHFEYEQTLIDFLWESDSKQIPTLRCDIPSPNIGRYLKLTVDSSNTEILDSNLELCFKEYFTEYQLNSENFHYFRTDLLKKYLEETNQVLMYQLKQHTYDQSTDKHSEHFRGMQFVFSPLNR